MAPHMQSKPGNLQKQSFPHVQDGSKLFTSPSPSFLAHIERGIAPPSGFVQVRCSIVVSISACHAEDPGSVPGGGVLRPVR